MAKSFFIKLQQTQEVEDFILNQPKAFAILSLIAVRVRRSLNSFNTDGLEIGEAYIGQEEFDGLAKSQRISRKQFRTLVGKILGKFLAIKTTNKGTIVKFKDSSIYDISLEEKGQQKGHKRASKGPLTENIEYRNISSSIDSDILAHAQQPKDKEKNLKEYIFEHDTKIKEENRCKLSDEELEILKKLDPTQDIEYLAKRCSHYCQFDRKKPYSDWFGTLRNWILKEKKQRESKDKKGSTDNYEDAGKRPFLNKTKVL